MFNRLNEEYNQMLLESLNADLYNFKGFRGIEVNKGESGIQYSISFQYFTVDLTSAYDNRSTYILQTTLGFDNTRSYSITSFENVFKQAMQNNGKMQRVVTASQMDWKVVESNGYKGYEILIVSSGDTATLSPFEETKLIVLKFYDFMMILLDALGTELNKK